MRRWQTFLLALVNVLVRCSLKSNLVSKKYQGVFGNLSARQDFD